MKTTDQVIDEILLNSPYGKKAYEDRQKRLQNDKQKEEEKEVIEDHPKQTFINFEDGKNNE
jgi:hypothetical protein